MQYITREDSIELLHLTTRTHNCLRRADMEYPHNQWGYGAIQLMQTFHLMREL